MHKKLLKKVNKVSGEDLSKAITAILDAVDYYFSDNEEV